MNFTFLHKPSLRWLAMPALAGSMFLTGCNGEPKTTDPDKTATVVEEHRDTEVEPVTPGDSTAAGAGTAEERDDD